MVILAAFGDPPPAGAIAAAAAALVAGTLVGVPTDTVYGLVGDPEELFRAKRRPAELHLPVLVADRAQAEALVGSIPTLAATLMERFWPGALTVVVPHGQATVGLRCPAHPVPVALCRVTGPLASTSANLHGQPPLATAAEVAAVLAANVAVVLDAGPCTASPSTVVEVRGEVVRLLRAGAVAWESVTAARRAGRTAW